MEKKKTPDKKEIRQSGKKAQNPAQQLAKQRLQRDMQKKLLDTRKKAKEQEQEQEQSPEAAATTKVEEAVSESLEQLAESIFATSRNLKSAKKGEKASRSVPTQKTRTSHNRKASYQSHCRTVPQQYSMKSDPRFRKAQTQNPAMKRWVHQRMILQRQKMRIHTKVKMQTSFVHHAQPETTAEQILPPGRRTSNITTQLLKAPINLYAPNAAWAHTIIQKKQAEFRQKYWISKTNPKKEIHKIEQIQKNVLHTKWSAHTPIERRSKDLPYITQKQQISAASSAPPSFPSTSGVDHTSKIKQQLTDAPMKTPMKTAGAPSATYRSANPPAPQQKRTPPIQQQKSSSVYQNRQQQVFARSWQNKQKQYMVQSRTTYARTNVWQKVQIIAEQVRLSVSHIGVWIAAFVLLLLLLFFGSVNGLVSSPFGVFFSSLETSPEARSVRAAITETNNEYFNRLDDLIRNTPHDTLVIRQIPKQQANDTQIHNWEEILAVFAVHTTTDPQTATDVVKLDDKRIQKLKDIFWQMVSIQHDTQTTGTGDNKKTTLTITIMIKSTEEMTDKLHFSKVQKGALDELLANRAWLTELIGQATGSGGGHGGGEYQVPPEALADEKFKAMITEAEKYLGYPYVWGGSSPSTSFDCSGFVSWVINKSGVGNVGRQTAQGLYDLCTPISKAQAKPGDLVFFTKTYNSAGPVSHIGIFVGDGKMIHCGDPIQYTSIETSYWKKHFYGFGRI